MKVKYEAFDGTVFNSRNQCEIYEDEHKLEYVNELKKKAVCNSYILNSGEYINSCEHDYYWYKVNSREELDDIIKKVESICVDIDDMGQIKEIKSYPTYICIEDADMTNDFEDECYLTVIDTCINNAISFFKQFGYEMEIKRNEESD